MRLPGLCSADLSRLTASVNVMPDNTLAEYYNPSEATIAFRGAYGAAYALLKREAPWFLYDRIPIPSGPYTESGSGEQLWRGKIMNMRRGTLQKLMVQTVFDA